MMRVSVRGSIYESVAEAAEALGVSASTVRSAIARGTTDTIGMGGGNPRGAMPHAKPVTIGPVIFPSMRAASAALGMAANYVHLVTARGGTAAREALVRRVMELHEAEKRGGA